MSAKVFTTEDAQAANVLLVEADRGSQAVHDLVTAYRANRRSGSANTKTRGEVRGNNKKIYKQKGTGGARHGDKRAPIFVGGGVVFGPRPRDYSKAVPKNVRKLALRRVLGDHVRDASIFHAESFSIADGKTKSFVSAVEALVTPGRVLIVASSFDAQTYQSARNVFWAQLITASELNVEQLLLADSVLLVGDAVSILAKRTA